MLKTLIPTGQEADPRRAVKPTGTISPDILIAMSSQVGAKTKFLTDFHKHAIQGLSSAS